MAISPVTIRPLAATDVMAFRELRLEALKRHPEAFTSDYAAQAAEPLSFWETCTHIAIDNPQQIICVAETPEGLVGMTGMLRGHSPKNYHSGLIWGVYVRPLHRQQQIGEKLLLACLEWGIQVGVTIAKLGVMVSNIPAIRCYTRCGFTQYGCEPRALLVNGEYVDEWLMSRIL